jgi:hypothetical protein
MNPLSSHPPRTPRTSIISTTNTVYSTEIYPSKDNTLQEPPPPEEVPELHQDDEAVKKRAQRIRRSEVWKEMLKTSAGRDKAFVRTICHPQR